MTIVNDLNEVINKYYWYKPRDNLKILVYAEDSKFVYGKTKIKITPVIGFGRVWVNLENLIEEPYPTNYQPLYLEKETQRLGE